MPCHLESDADLVSEKGLSEFPEGWFNKPVGRGLRSSDGEVVGIRVVGGYRVFCRVRKRGKTSPGRGHENALVFCAAYQGRSALLLSGAVGRDRRPGEFKLILTLGIRRMR